MEKDKEEKKEIEEAEEQEESGLEEDIEEAEVEIEEDKFVEFMNSSIGNFSTTLGQVATAHEFRATDLEQDTSNIIAFQEGKKDDEKKYETQIMKDYDRIDEMPKTQNEDFVMRQTTPINLETIGRDIMRPRFEQNLQFNPELQELREKGRSLDGDYVVKEKGLDSSEPGLPFQQETKYKGKSI